MNLTVERTELLGQYLQEDVDRANKLLELTPDEAAKLINADGYDFSAEEVAEFGENLKAASATNEELSEESLSEVSGGVIAGAAIAVYVACVALGVKLGVAAGSHKKW